MTSDASSNSSNSSNSSGAANAALIAAAPKLLAALKALTGMAEAFPSELHAKHPDVVAARELIARCAA